MQQNAFLKFLSLSLIMGLLISPQCYAAKSGETDFVICPNPANPGEVAYKCTEKQCTYGTNGGGKPSSWVFVNPTGVSCTQDSDCAIQRYDFLVLNGIPPKYTSAYCYYYAVSSTFPIEAINNNDPYYAYVDDVQACKAGGATMNSPQTVCASYNNSK